MATFQSVLELARLIGTDGFRLDGTRTDGRFGRSVASAGDVNGDGFDDVIVGAYRANTYAGECYVIFGKASGFASRINVSTLNGVNGFRLEGVRSDSPGVRGDQTGFSVAGAGDFNGDGVDDLIIGALTANPDGIAGAGSTYVVFGNQSGFAPSINLSTLDGATGFRLDGANVADSSGTSVAFVGDIDNDGFDDIVIGAFRADPFSSSPNTGASYVVFGKQSGIASSLDLSSLNGVNGFRLVGVARDDYSGISVASAGDVDGDGFADLIIAAYRADADGRTDAGSSYVVFGKRDGFAASIDLSTLDGRNGFRLDGVAAGDKSGRPAASAGDINGDGFDDLIIGAPASDPDRDGQYEGASYVVFGKREDFASSVNLASLNGVSGFRLEGISPGDASGFSVASAGDVNGDGFDDLIIGANRADPAGRTEAGSSYVVFGKALGFAPVIDLALLDGNNGFRLDGVAIGDRSGVSVASAGDVNGDGFGDLIVGADDGDVSTPVPDGGSSFVIFGRAPDSAVNRIGSAASQHILGGAFNDTLSGLGGNDTLDGRGGSDSLVGGVGNDSLQGRAGNDTVSGGLGADSLDGGADIDTFDLTGNTANATVSLLEQRASSAQSGIDTIVGFERIVAGSGNDRLTGDAGLNVLEGRGGNDVLTGLGGSDNLNGGAGLDTASFEAETGNMRINLAAGTSQGLVSGADTLASIENVVTGFGDDTIVGNSARNRIEARTGNDTVNGGGGRDRLDGGAGNDVLAGGNGRDLLIGGSGSDSLWGGALGDSLVGGGAADRFVFRSVFESSTGATRRDAVLDFAQAQGDRIDLSVIDAKENRPGNQTFGFIGTNAFNGVSGQVRVQQSNGDTFVFGNTDNDLTAEFSLKLEGLHTLTALDFVL